MTVTLRVPLRIPLRVPLRIALGSFKGSLEGSRKGSFKGSLEVPSGWKNTVWGFALESFFVHMDTIQISILGLGPVSSTFQPQTILQRHLWL